MHEIPFLQDIALVTVVAGLVTILFHKLRQPVVLGYILAGLLIGPHTPPYKLVHDQHTIDIMAELGVILLMFGLGLHFSLRDLARVGATAAVSATLEILSLLALGYGMGRLFGWTSIDSIFLGAMLSVSSTTIIVKALQELGLTKEKFSGVVFGILIVEDILAIAMLVLLAGVATTGKLGGMEILVTLGKLTVFLSVTLVAGLLVVPRALRYVDKFKNPEVLLIASLALCFGIASLAAQFGYSVALGAFLAGALVAESRERGKIELLVQPVRDLFSALFFVAIGMMIEPKMLVTYAGPIVAITALVVVGKVISCGIGSFVTGHPPRVALKVGLSLAQIGEFSFIIASLGLKLKVISPFLYPVAVTVSAVTTLLTPYLIKNSDLFATWLGRIAPAPVASYLRGYGRWFSGEDRARNPMNVAVRRMLVRWGVMTGLNMLLVTGLFIAAPHVAIALEQKLPDLPEWTGGVRSVVWFAATAAALPLLVVTVQKLRAASMLLAELWTTHTASSPLTSSATASGQAVIAHALFVVGTFAVALWVTILSLAVLPPWPVAVALLALLGALVAWRWKAYAKLYARAQKALEKTLQEGAEHQAAGHHEEEKRVLPPALVDAEIAPIEILPGTRAAGKLIREIELRTRSGASAIAIERNGKSIISPGPDEELAPGDRLLLLGSARQIEDGRKLLQEAAA